MLHCISVSLMKKSWIKAGIIFCLVFASAFGTFVCVNPWQIVRLDLNKFKIASTVPQVSKHVRGYGIDIQEAEEAYCYLETFLGIPKVNRVVYIYRANPIDSNGAIGIFSGIRFDGIYKQDAITKHDVIIYGGNSSVLYHELMHFFFAHTRTVYNTEICAQLLVQNLILKVQYTELRQQVLKFLEFIS